MTVLLLYVLCIAAYAVMAMNTVNKHVLCSKMFVHMGEGNEIEQAATTVKEWTAIGQDLVENIDTTGHTVTLLESDLGVNKRPEYAIASISLQNKQVTGMTNVATNRVTELVNIIKNNK